VVGHWNVKPTAVTRRPRPRTIPAFYGFPQPLFDMRYPAPGLPELAEEVADVAQPDYVGADHDSWGLDHGTWSVLVHAFPDADIPVVQLSIDANKPAVDHLALGARLAALRARGVLLMGSGNVVHNLRAMDRQHPDAGFDWARRFNERALAVMRDAPADATALVHDADYRLAAPTDEHFLPLLYIAGFAAQTGVQPAVLVDGYTYGSLSMTSYTVGIDTAAQTIGLPGAAPLPADVPPESTNV